MTSALIIGIDPGVSTGVAVWSMAEGRLIEVFSRDMFDAIQYLLQMKMHHELFIVLEDARLMKTRPKADSQARKQGSGSVKRDCSLWQTWAKKMGIPMYRRAPGVGTKKAAGITKWTAERFRAYTGWQFQTNDHERDAAMLVFDTTAPHLALMREHAAAQAAPKVNHRRKPTKKTTP